MKADEEKVEEKPKAQYKHVPKHAAADSAGQGGRNDSYMDRAQIAIASRQRMENSPYDSTLSNASFAQEIAHNMAHGTPSGPPSPNTQRAMLSGAYSEDGHYNNSDRNSLAPSFKNRSSINGAKLHRSSTDYFANSNAYGKQPVSYYSDSGYESAEPASAMHSRVPSEHNLYDSSKGYPVQNTTLPELALSGENSLEAEIAANSRSIGNVSPLDLNSDARSIKSNRSVSKRTRFEGDAEPMPALNQLEQHRKDSGETSPSVQPHQPETFVQLQHPQSRTGSLPPLAILEGFKVNKKGKILDEEGEPIGELVEGELLDCVRQKANAVGEVVDEYGRVVGQVRTCAPHAVPAIVAPTQQLAPAVTGVNPQKSETAAAPQAVQQPEAMEKPAQVPVQVETLPAAVRPEELPRSEHATGSPVQQVISQPTAVPQLSLPAQESKRIPRSASERSLSELSKPYARPTMSSVPEDNVPVDDSIPASPTLYAYKGEIPVTDGVQQSNRRSRSPPSASNPKALPGPGQYAKSALVGGHAGNSLFPPARPVGMGYRRQTTHFSGGPVPVNRQPLHSAMKKSAGKSTLVAIPCSFANSSSLRYHPKWQRLRQ